MPFPAQCENTNAWMRTRTSISDTWNPTQGIVRARWNKLIQQEKWHEWERAERWVWRWWRARCMGCWVELVCHCSSIQAPCQPVFVTSDVSIKTKAAIRSHPLPTAGLPLRPPCSAGTSAAFHPRPCPLLALPLSPSLQHIHKHAAEDLIVLGGPGGCTLLTPEWKKSSRDRSRATGL